MINKNSFMKTPRRDINSAKGSLMGLQGTDVSTRMNGNANTASRYLATLLSNYLKSHKLTNTEKSGKVFRNVISQEQVGQNREQIAALRKAIPLLQKKELLVLKQAENKSSIADCLDKINQNEGRLKQYEQERREWKEAQQKEELDKKRLIQSLETLNKERNLLQEHKKTLQSLQSEDAKIQGFLHEIQRNEGIVRKYEDERRAFEELQQKEDSTQKDLDQQLAKLNNKQNLLKQEEKKLQGNIEDEKIMEKVQNAFNSIVTLLEGRNFEKYIRDLSRNLEEENGWHKDHVFGWDNIFSKSDRNGGTCGLNVKFQESINKVFQIVQRLQNEIESNPALKDQSLEVSGIINKVYNDLNEIQNKILNQAKKPYNEEGCVKFFAACANKESDLYKNMLQERYTMEKCFRDFEKAVQPFSELQQKLSSIGKKQEFDFQNSPHKSDLLKVQNELRRIGLEISSLNAKIQNRNKVSPSFNVTEEALQKAKADLITAKENLSKINAAKRDLENKRSLPISDLSQVQKEIDLIESKISSLNDKIKHNSKVPPPFKVSDMERVKLKKVLVLAEANLSRLNEEKRDLENQESSYRDLEKITSLYSKPESIHQEIDRLSKEIRHRNEFKKEIRGKVYPFWLSEGHEAPYNKTGNTYGEEFEKKVLGNFISRVNELPPENYKEFIEGIFSKKVRDSILEKEPKAPNKTSTWR